MNSASAMPRIAASLLAALTLSCSQPRPAPLQSVPERFLAHLAAIPDTNSRSRVQKKGQSADSNSKCRPRFSGVI